VELTTPEAVYEFMKPLGEESSEYVYEVLMDARNFCQGVYLAGKGGNGNSHVHPGEIYKAALITNAPGFVLAHNHPSGDLTPSRQDLDLAEKKSTANLHPLPDAGHLRRNFFGMISDC
jgi:DNA repair protein RadC